MTIDEYDRMVRLLSSPSMLGKTEIDWTYSAAPSVYIGMYVHLERWPERVDYQRQTITAPAIRRFASLDELLLPHIGVNPFKTQGYGVGSDDGAVVPLPKHAHELGGTIIENPVNDLKFVIEAFQRSEYVAPEWYVLCASLQRHNALFQPRRGLVIIQP
jgi:hypothetical protein